MSGHLVTTKQKQHLPSARCYFDLIVSRWELNRIVHLPFCVPFSEFACCLHEAITEASKRLSNSGLKEIPNT